jgi:Zn-dependent protease
MRHSKEIKIWSLSTSEAEIKGFIKAWVAISAAFAILLSRPVFSPGFYAKFVLASLTVGTGFLLHELGHKVVAQRYKCFAEFRSFDLMLVLAVAMSFFGFIMAAPGAVMVSGKINKSKNGMISAAGPVVNLLLAAIFLALIFAPLPKLFKDASHYGFAVNSWLALFNMIPFWLFDGCKVLKWSKAAYGSIVSVAVVFMLLQSFIGLG